MSKLDKAEQKNSAAAPPPASSQADGAREPTDEGLNQAEPLPGPFPQADAQVDEPADAQADGEGGEDALRRQLQEAREEAEGLRGQMEDQALRNIAELQNERRRAQEQIDKARRFAAEKFALQVLPVLDNLERALEASAGEAAQQALLEGVSLTHKSFVDALAAFGVAAQEPVGEPFDPQRHEAVTTLESADAPPNQVLSVIQKGYLMEGRLLRAAMVVVARAPQANAPDQASDDARDDPSAAAS